VKVLNWIAGRLVSGGGEFGPVTWAKILLGSICKSTLPVVAFRKIPPLLNNRKVSLLLMANGPLVGGPVAPVPVSMKNWKLDPVELAIGTNVQMPSKYTYMNPFEVLIQESPLIGNLSRSVPMDIFLGGLPIPKKVPASLITH
jgi:hypothetical protein